MARSILTPFTFNVGGNTINNVGAATVPLTIKGAGSQSAALFEIRNSSNTLLSYTLSNGDWVMPNLYNSYAGVGTGYADYQGGATSLYVRPTATTRSGAVIKGLSSQTANLLEIQDSSGNIHSGILSTGFLFVGGSSSAGGQIGITAEAATNRGMVIKAAASQTANLVEWQNSSSTILSRISSSGQFVSDQQTYIGSGATSISNTRFNVASGSASVIAVTIRGASSQSANLTEWQTWDGTTATTVANMSAAGVFSAISKSFLIEHPTKSGMKLRYGSLEGPENGVYVRGRSKSKEIELPEYWTKLVDEDTITVTLTPIGKQAKLFIKKIENNKIYIGGRKNVEYFYTVFAERKDIPKLIVEE